ncbi:hypothetical protein Tco_1259514 [Tanacetum coccineum]
MEITPKRVKIKEEEDRISELQDCLLIDIIRLPTTKEAIRTGRKDNNGPIRLALRIRSSLAEIDLRNRLDARAGMQIRRHLTT